MNETPIGTQAPISSTSCLTPPGRGAIATLAVREPQAWTVIRELFVSKKPLPTHPAAGGIWLGRLGLPGSTDVAVLSVPPKEPVAWVELHCHGGPEVIRLVTEEFSQRGITPVRWEEFLRGSGEESTRALARVLLAQAPTVRTASILLDQLHGAFDDAIEDIRRALQAGELPQAQNRLTEVLRHAPVGRHLIEPWKVVIAGAPNVGKSSLVNALAGYQRSVVSPLPGTTRDLVTTLLAIDGWPVEVADTAGWRTTSEPLERSGIDLARDAATNADLCLWVLDASAPPEYPAADLAARLIINKVDLPAAWDAGALPDAVNVSATSGTGLPELCAYIARALVPDPPSPGVPLPFSESMIAGLHTALDRCQRADAAGAIQALGTIYSP